MRAGRLVLLSAMLGFVLLCEKSLQAQWATSVIEQDWTITVFGGRFGYEQSVIFPGGLRAAKLYWGGGNIQISSGSGAKSMRPVMGVFLVVATIVLWRIRARRTRRFDPPTGRMPGFDTEAVPHRLNTPKEGVKDEARAKR